VGDLDGWSTYGTLPSGTTVIVGTGLRRGSVYPLASPQPTGLLKEVQETGTGGPTTAAAIGIQRTMTTKVGSTYVLAGTMLSLQDTTPSGYQYRWAVSGIGNGTTASITNTSTPVTIPSYTFVATSTSTVIQIQLNQAVSWSASGWFEDVAFYGITMTEVPNTSDRRLQDVAYTGPLSTHFSMACDTVGAAWWVDKTNTTKFRQADDSSALKATFTDARATGKHEYVDISAGYDTRNVVNSITVNNHGRNAGTGNAQDVTYTASDSTSIASYGVRSGSLDMEMRSGYIDLTNLVTNPSGETATTGYAAVAGTTGVAAVTSASPSVTSAFGTKVLKTTWSTANTASGAGITYDVPVTAGTVYSFAFNHFLSSIPTRVAMNVEWRTAAATISTTSGSATDTTYTATPIYSQSFDTNTTDSWAAGASTTVTRVTTAPQAGTGHLQFVRASGTTALTASRTITGLTPGRQYVATAYMRESATGTGTRTGFLQVTGFTAGTPGTTTTNYQQLSSGIFIATSTSHTLVLNSTNTTSAAYTTYWDTILVQEYTPTVMPNFKLENLTAPATATIARMSVLSLSGGLAYQNQAIGTYHEADGLMAVAGTTVPTYFDGSYTDLTGNYLYAWTGTAHASTSTRTTFAILNTRIAEVIAARKTPARVITSIRWNAQEDPLLASSLDVQDRVRVEFRGQIQDSRIVGIKHNVSGSTWMLQLDLVPG